MSQADCILAIDQGTTSSRAIVFSVDGKIISIAQQEFPQSYPNDGWVEHDAEAIWNTSLKTAQQAFEQAESSGFRVAAIGVTNQRETTLIWDRETHHAVYPAIVWQDRRTADTCRQMRERGLESVIQEKTGLLLDPYFSASKIAWILDQVDNVRHQAELGKLAFGTVDSFLIWRLTSGRTHATDATNASRTSLFNIQTQQWDDELLKLFNVPKSILPDVRDCADDYGTTDPALFGRAIPILGVAGDQQAAAFGQCCFESGSIKSTYGTGCFVLMNTGETLLKSENRLLSTVAYRYQGKTSYALEGSIFIAGAGVQWLRDELKLIGNAAETEALASSLSDNGGVYFVPSLTGLGAPYWEPDARGAIFGLSRATGKAEIGRAALEAVCYQTHDLFQAMAQDGLSPNTLRIDGGMVANNWLSQFLADILNLTVDRPVVMETTALGAAYLAGLKAGIYENFEQISQQWQRQSRFEPQISDADRQRFLRGWKQAVQKVIN